LKGVKTDGATNVGKMLAEYSKGGVAHKIGQRTINIDLDDS